MFMKHITHIIVCSLFLIFHLSAAKATTIGRQYVLTGKTMGTFYTIKFISHKNDSLPVWKSRVDTRLKEINKKLSMFDPKSELSLFNRVETQTPFAISSDFYALMRVAETLYQMTDGAWDGTVKPLVDLWGFGTKTSSQHIPGIEQINLALSKTGFNHIQIRAPHTISKKKAVTLDLGSIAKGYGVDAVADLFHSFDVRNILVEIGGELYASGKNKKGKLWVVGINTPDKNYADPSLYKIVRLDNQAIATSGNYRNFFEINGKTYSHIIDPKTGYPVDNKIVSASVISGDCTFADGLATALMVMDVKKGIDLVNRIENTECLIIEKNGQNLESHVSEQFNRFAVE